MLRTLVLAMLVSIAAGATIVRAQTAPESPVPGPSTKSSPSVNASDAADPYLWLEDVTSPRALAWVRGENAKSLGVLQADSLYSHLYADALTIAQAKDRIPTPAFIAGDVYNFWQDANHVRGIWRYTTLADYARAVPRWQTALDLDAVAKDERANWVWEGADCLEPSERRCMVSLSDGGEDAIAAREYDLSLHSFARDGFTLPRGKQNITWETLDSLLVAREWNPGEVTASGYPYVLKRVLRGQPLSQAVEVFRGDKSDVSVSATLFTDAQQNRLIVVDRGLTFFTSEQYLLAPSGVRRIGVPSRVFPKALVDGRVLFQLNEDWTAAGTTFRAGSLVSVDLAALEAQPDRLSPTLVYAPGPRDSLDAITTTSSHLILSAAHNVQGRAFVYTALPAGAWASRPVALPAQSSIGIVDADQHDESFFISVTGYLTPTTLWLSNAQSGTLSIAKSLPPKFDASGDVVEQREATSSDGVNVPYFIVHPKAMRLDGNNPTILNAYGGFQVSRTPAYSALIGKLWLERGGVYVVANIRGGGEFGPAWHEAGLKTHRQRVYDDFTAVARDLIARRVTSPRRLGIQGGSNGGLLMGVEFTQHPELWSAVDMQIPLLDMLRFEKIAAGASWVGEYGSVSVPSERAFLASVSPYNNLRRNVTYPQPFIWTTTKDDRVGPQHARKFAARLAEMGIPYLFYEVTEGGHGQGANLEERSKTTALEMTYFIRKLMDPSPR